MQSFERGTKDLIRLIAYSTHPVDGRFRFEDDLQIFSLPGDAPKPQMSYADHPFVIEYSFEQMDIAVLREVRTSNLGPSSDIPPDNFLKIDYHFSKQQEILSILSVITCYLIKKERAGHIWVLDNSGGGRTGKFAQTGYYWEGFRELGDWFSQSDLPEIAFVDSKTYYNRHGSVSGESLELSDATNQLLVTYFQLDDEEQEAFLSACVLFSQALETWSVSHSLAYIGIVCSLEALIEFDHRSAKESRCSECGQLAYKVRKKFLDFFADYGSPDTELKKFADHLYGRRSGIGHKGELLAADVAGRVVPPHDEAQDHWELMNLNVVARLCLVNWLMTRV